MFNLVTNLELLKSTISKAINQPTDTRDSNIQVGIDLLLNYPAKNKVSIEELITFLTRGPWIQYMGFNSNYSLSNITGTYANKILYFEITTNPNYNDWLNSVLYSNVNNKDILSLLTNLNNDNIIKYNDRLRHCSFDIQFDVDNTENQHNKLSNVFTDNIISRHNVYATNCVLKDFYKTQVMPETLDPRSYSILQIPTNNFDYHIDKHPFEIKKDSFSPAIASSNHKFPKKEFLYDIMVYPDKIVYISEGGLSDQADFKVFKIPELTLLESGRDFKLSIYQKLNITRENIIGPNMIRFTIDDLDKLHIFDYSCRIKNGFRIDDNGLVYDIYMNSVREKCNCPIRYKQFAIYDDFINIYF